MAWACGRGAWRRTESCSAPRALDARCLHRELALDANQTSMWSARSVGGPPIPTQSRKRAPQTRSDDLAEPHLSARRYPRFSRRELVNGVQNVVIHSTAG